jgi:hypothetical protein
LTGANLAWRPDLWRAERARPPRWSRRGEQARLRRRGAVGADAVGDPQELQLLRIGGTRGHRVDDEADVAARDGEHVAVAEPDLYIEYFRDLQRLKPGPEGLRPADIAEVTSPLGSRPDSQPPTVEGLTPRA